MASTTATHTIRHRDRHPRWMGGYHESRNGVVDPASTAADPLQKEYTRLHDLHASKVALRNNVLELVSWESSFPLVPRRHRQDHGHLASDNATSDLQQAIEQLQEELDKMNATIRSLVQLLTSELDLNSSSVDSSPGVAATSADPIAPSSVTTSTTRISNSVYSASTHFPTESPLHATDRPGSYTFDPMSHSNVALYYGQTDQTSKVPLSRICVDPDVDIIILAFVTMLFGPGGWPAINMGAHCWAPIVAQTGPGASGLIDCVSDGFAAEAAQCQAQGKKVFLSLGGAKDYSNLNVQSEEAAGEVAETLWNLFLGGTDNSTTNAMRPFGDFVFDGFDIDNESGSSTHWPILLSSLRTLMQKDTSKPYYLSAAPQCPRPDASIPLSSMQSVVDYIWVQFYNNPSCNFNTGTSFLDSLRAWSGDLAGGVDRFVDIGNGVSSPRLYVGAPAFQAAGSGFVDGDEFGTIMDSIYTAGVANLGGAMFWDGAYGEESGESRTDGATYMHLSKVALE